MSRSTVIHIGALEPHPDNIRENVGDIAEIAASMVAHGIIQPLVVSPREDKPGHFWIIAGNRRYYAARRARIEQIPVTIRRDDLTPAQITEIMLIENCQRADLNPIERAEAMGRLRKAGKTNLEIARSIGVSDATVSYFLALLELDAASQERVRNGSIPVGLALAGVRRTRPAARQKAGQKPRRAPGGPRVGRYSRAAGGAPGGAPGRGRAPAPRAGRPPPPGRVGRPRHDHKGRQLADLFRMSSAASDAEQAAMCRAFAAAAWIAVRRHGAHAADVLLCDLDGAIRELTSAERTDVPQ